MLFFVESHAANNWPKVSIPAPIFLWSKDDLFYLYGLAYFESRRQIRDTEFYTQGIQGTL